MKSFRRSLIFAALLAGAALLAPASAAERKSDASRGAQKAEKRGSVSAKVDLNTADLATLEALPGVGPEIARAIIAARPFKSLDDLERVRGIGPERLEQIRNEVTVSPPVAGTKQRLGEPPLPPTGRNDPAAARVEAAKRAPVNVNTASQQELEVLPGIGPVKAAAIVEARMERPFKTKEDLMRVKGIKEDTLNEIKDLITVR